MRRLWRCLGIGFWVAAWGCWVWLGVGLYRELPRRLGEPVCTLPVEKRSTIAGFVGTTNQMAIIADSPKFTTTVQVFDAETGGLVKEIPSPMRRMLLAPRLDPVQHRFLFSGELPDPKDGVWAKGLFVLDVAKAAWRRAGDVWTRNAVHHPTRPWLLFQPWAPASSVTIPIVVFDYEAGKEVFRTNLPIWNLPDPGPFFDGEGRVAIPFRGPFVDPTRDNSRGVELWRIGEPSVHESTMQDVPFGPLSAQHVARGRIAFLEGPPWIVRVFDLDRRTIIFSSPTQEFTGAMVRAFGAPVVHPRALSAVVSTSGRRVFGNQPPALWDVDSGRVIWCAGPHEMAWSADSDDQFQVIEKWSNLWTRWLPSASLDYVTYAFRNLESGALVYRTADKAALRPTNRNAAGTLAVSDDGKVYRLPLPVNWVLLGLCQLVLAMPLVGLWAVVKWRRARRAKRVSATMSTLASASS